CRRSRTVSRCRSRPARRTCWRRTERSSTKAFCGLSRRAAPYRNQLSLTKGALRQAQRAVRQTGLVHVALASTPDGRVTITPLGDSGVQQTVTRAALPAAVTLLEAQRPRWVWDDTTRWYPPLL